MERDRAQTSVRKAQRPAQDDTSNVVPLKSRKEQLQRKQMVGEHVGCVRIHERPDETKRVQRDTKNTDTGGVRERRGGHSVMR